MLYKEEIPIANGMIELANNTDSAFQKYFCFWTAFNNIYTIKTKRLAENPGTPSRSPIKSELIREMAK